MGGRGGPLFQNLEGQSGLCQHPVDIRVWDGMLFQQVFEDWRSHKMTPGNCAAKQSFKKNRFLFPRLLTSGPHFYKNTFTTRS